ncbi:MFS transporter [Allostreptomyces psammosilenae]|uniref:MFS family permease n=1 Tax=Allostreptomyces psammosilenae TaxID=1892865 RepID=A0A852ZQ76_9ACTN|nr:MFS transporter [Allostreptomyces psammosilenae]NYI03647.1 MFS family permease [Allostreptomyces psammosilenae]
MDSADPARAGTPDGASGGSAGLAPGGVALRRRRVAVSLLFLLAGTVIGTWTARIPAVKEGLGLGDGGLSIGLLALAAGSITGMQAVGRLVDRWGGPRIAVPAVFADGAMLVLPAHATGLPTLAVALFVFGAAHGALNVAMNAAAVEVEQAARRPIMSSFHAFYSIGGFLGAAVGGVFAGAGLGTAATFTTVAVGVFLLAPWAARWVLPSRPARAPADAAPADRPGDGRRAGRSGGVFFLGVLGFSCLVGEGAAADWSTVYLRDSLGSGAGFAAAAYAAFSVAMTAGRLAGDRLAAALGRVTLVRCCGLVAAVGLGAALLVHHPVAGVVGFGCLGAGLSCIAPQVFSAAGNRDPARAGQAIARVASLSYLGFFVGPVVIGAVAELSGLPLALGIPAVLALFVAAAAPALRAPTTAEPPRAASGASG